MGLLVVIHLTGLSQFARVALSSQIVFCFWRGINGLN